MTKNNSKIAHWWATLKKQDLIVAALDELNDRDKRFRAKAAECRKWKAMYIKLSGAKDD